jgi:hypothetical protein
MPSQILASSFISHSIASAIFLTTHHTHILIEVLLFQVQFAFAPNSLISFEVSVSHSYAHLYSHNLGGVLFYYWSLQLNLHFQAKLSYLGRHSVAALMFIFYPEFSFFTTGVLIPVLQVVFSIIG